MVEAMVVVEGIVSISPHTVKTSQINSRGLATNKTTINKATTNSSNLPCSLLTANNNHSSNSSNTVLVDHTTSTTTTNRDTRHPQGTNKRDTHNSNSMGRRHSKPSNRQRTRIIRIITLGTSNSKLGTAVMARLDINRFVELLL